MSLERWNGFAILHQLNHYIISCYIMQLDCMDHMVYQSLNLQLQAIFSWINRLRVGTTYATPKLTQSSHLRNGLII